MRRRATSGSSRSSIPSSAYADEAATTEEAGMYPRNLQVERRTDARTAFAIAALLIAGLAGCASDPTPKPNGPPADVSPYVGVFTGEFVDGKPLYRFPPIVVVGYRSSIGRATEPDEGAGHDKR